jgi:hypothetical protein
LGRIDWLLGGSTVLSANNLGHVDYQRCERVCFMVECSKVSVSWML